MNRSEYIKKIEDGIKKMSEVDRAEAIRYYEEYFDEAGPENEERAISELEDPDIIAKRLMAEYACTQMEIIESKAAGETPESEARNKDENSSDNTQTIHKTVKHSMNYVWMIVLGICVSPVAIPLVIALVSVIFSFFVVIFTMIFVFLLLAVVFTICGVAVLAVGIVGIFTNVAVGITGIGAGLVLVGLGLLTCVLFFATVSKVVPAMVRGTGRLFRKVSGGAK